MTQTEQYLTAVVDMWKRAGKLAPPKGFAYMSMEDFVLANGRLWPVAVEQRLVPSPVIYPQRCFDNAFRIARRWPSRYRYVEGVAMGIIPVHHAWVVNRADEVIDATWFQYSTVGTEYFGVEIPLDVAKSVRNRQNHSILMNWEKGYPLFREPWRASA